MSNSGYRLEPSDWDGYQYQVGWTRWENEGDLKRVAENGLEQFQNSSLDAILAVVRQMQERGCQVRVHRRLPPPAWEPVPVASLT